MELVAEIMGEMPDYMSRALEELPLANLAFPQLEMGPGVDMEHHELRELALATYANHDNAPLVTTFTHLLQAAKINPEGEEKINPEGEEAAQLNRLLRFAGWKRPVSEIFTEESLSALQNALFTSRSRLAVLMCSDLFGLPLRFNLPGSYGIETWCDRLPMTVQSDSQPLQLAWMIKRGSPGVLFIKALMINWISAGGGDGTSIAKVCRQLYQRSGKPLPNAK